VKYLFDTDIITNIFKKRPSGQLLARLAETPSKEQYISTITVSEIVYGAWKSRNPEQHLRNLENILLPAVRIVDFDSKAAYICGKLRARLEVQGQPLALADLEVASVAIANNMVLVSGNTRHFSRIAEISLENWLI